MSSKAALHTLGCRLNQAETEIIAKNLQDKGFEIVPWGAQADLTVINTCTVTGQAESKCRQAVRQSIRKNPATFVAVIGCYAQMSVETISQIEGVDLIAGNEHKMKLADILHDDLKKNDTPVIHHSKKISRDPFVIETIGLYDTQTRANLKIQDGCNFVCSFCIIAKARGPARSRQYEDIIDEAKRLIDRGFKEIVLTGVNIGTWRENGRRFVDLLQGLDKISGLQRLRISSIEPTTVDREVIDFMAAAKTVCRHLHIPLQSGDNRILDSMRRKHTSDYFNDIVEYAAQKIPGIGLGTDIMVGYPGENQDAFVNTKKLIADSPVNYFHVFSYSDRRGTTAFKLKPKVDYHEKKKRNRIMIEVGKRKKAAFYQSFIGRKIDVLFEEQSNGHWEGFSDNYMRIKVKSDRDLKNELLPVQLTETDGEQISGVLI